MFLILHRWDFDVSYVSHIWLSLKVGLPRICMCECISIYIYLHTQDPFQMGFKLLIQVIGMKKKKKEKGNKAQAILSPTRVNECACVCSSASIHVTMHPWEDRRESVICPSLRVWRPLSVRTASLWGWLWCFMKQIFQPTRAQGVESWCMKFKFCLMLRETAVTSNSVGETGVMNFRQAVSGVWRGASKVIFKDNSDELFSPFILILEPNCTTCSDRGLLFYLSAFNLHHHCLYSLRIEQGKEWPCHFPPSWWAPFGATQLESSAWGHTPG